MVLGKDKTGVGWVAPDMTGLVTLLLGQSVAGVGGVALLFRGIPAGSAEVLGRVVLGVEFCPCPDFNLGRFFIACDSARLVV